MTEWREGGGEEVETDRHRQTDTDRQTERMAEIDGVAGEGWRGGGERQTDRHTEIDRHRETEIRREKDRHLEGKEGVDRYMTHKIGTSHYYQIASKIRLTKKYCRKNQLLVTT